MPTIGHGETTIHYEVEGSGSTLVLHTGGGGGLRMWRMAGYTEGLPGRRIAVAFGYEAGSLQAGSLED